MNLYQKIQIQLSNGPTSLDEISSMKNDISFVDDNLIYGKYFKLN